MDDFEPQTLPSPPEPHKPLTASHALAQIVMASGVPTQLLLIVGLQLLGLRMGSATQPAPLFVAMVALLDSAVLLGLIVWFLIGNGEQPREVLIGRRPARDALLGLALLPVVFIVLLVLIATITRVFPWLHTVPTNPYESFFTRPADAILFGVVVVVAGGVREEIQRGFILHRFSPHRTLGGPRIGLLVWSLAFGAGHYPQGWDVAAGMACVGAFWGWLTLRRRSTVASMVNHAAFDLVQVAKMAVMKGLGA